MGSNNLKIKVCGITSSKDAITAINFGADLIGFIFYKKSPRYTNQKTAKQISKNIPATIFRVGVFVNEDKEKYHFYVKDNGPGITPSKQQKIFNIFQTATSKDKYGNSGHGIGLATVKKLIQQMDGEISLESTKEIGSKFVFSFNKILK